MWLMSPPWDSSTSNSTHRMQCRTLLISRIMSWRSLRDMTLHTEDLEDSITTLRSMRECGFPIADEMIKDIDKSLAIMSTKQPKRGMIRSPSLSFQMGRTSSWGPVTWGRNADGEIIVIICHQFLGQQKNVPAISSGLKLILKSQHKPRVRNLCRTLIHHYQLKLLTPPPPQLWQM
ncbi:hypothetical protein HYC85_008821 [Camellia sinensis]|uniref:Uncharacterized protein n=1 Tax=Camellia sinensis TaxID=4442 RepID=A0A7J7HTX8_CAMSI|nr:hypothetical protein HYC85_008821 [Camellia sinensis]